MSTRTSKPVFRWGRRMWRDTSLRSRLVALVSALVASLAAVVLILYPMRTKAQVRLWAETRSVGIAQFVASAAEAALDFDDEINARQLLESLESTPGALYGRFERADGSILSSWNPRRVALPVPPPRDGTDVRGDVLYVRLQMRTRGGQRGALLLAFNLADFERGHREATNVAWVVAGLILFVGGVAAFGAGTLLVRPVGRLTDLALRIANGEGAARRELELGRGDEVGQLSKALDAMLQKLLEEKALAESLSDVSVEGIVIVGDDNVIVRHNQRVLQLWGLPSASLKGQPVDMLFRVITADLIAPVHLLEMSMLEQQELLLKDGRIISAYRTPVQSEEGTRFGGAYFFRDVTDKHTQERIRLLNRELEQRVTERTRELEVANGLLAQRIEELRKTQEQLIVADRRLSVGTLAAGVAHEVNNPLAFILSNLQFVSNAVRESSGADARFDSETLNEMREALSDALEGCERVRFIVQSLKTFSRGDEDKRVPVDVTEPLEAAISMAANEIKHRCRLVRDYGTVQVVLASQVELAQVFLNMLINAAHSIESGHAEKNEIRVSTFMEGDRVAIAIRDTGTGIAPEVRVRLFTPFFTTKPVGVGTGLGLSVCQGIVHKFGGEIRVESEMGKGTCFTILLPQTKEHGITVVDPPGRISGQSARILVIDDEVMIGTAIRRQLKANHNVIAVTAATQALRILREGETFDLILCDVMMPEMTGMEFYSELCRLAPDKASRIVFMTGGAFTEAAREFLDLHRERVLQKPLDLNELDARIRTELQWVV